VSMFGGGFGGPGGGPGSGPMGGLGGIGAAGKNAQPFTGVPDDLIAGVSKLEAREIGRDAKAGGGFADHGDPRVRFTHRPDDTRLLTMVSLVRRHRAALVLACLMLLAETLLLQAGPYLIQVGIDHGIVARDLPVLVLATAIFAATVVGTGFASAARIRQTGKLAAYAMRDLRVRVFAHLQRLSMDYFTEEKAGVTMTRMTSDIEALQQLLQDGLAQFLIQGLTMVLVAVVLFSYNVELALITLLLVLPPLVALSLWFRSAADRGYRRQRDAIAALFADLSESLAGVRVVIAHNRQARNVEHHRTVVGKYRDASDHTGHISALYGPGTSIIGMLGLAALLLVGGRMVLRGELSIGELTAFVLYLNAFFQPVQQLVQLYTNYQQARAAVVKLRDLLETPPSVPERPGAAELPPITGEIVFSDVWFGYDPARPVLRGVDLRIAPGEKLAVVGPTGAGKSTLAKLVIRLHDPDSGRVLIDGHDLRDVTLTSLRRQIGVVPQEPFLFAGSIRDNVAFGRPEATDEELWAAIDAVGLRELVERSPLGLDAQLHERGQSLSSGERQLLALARTFAAQPRVVVLDEATSSLDLRSERRVEAALDALLDGRTTILVAHRLSTAARADRIIVVEPDGFRGGERVAGSGIAETGSHEELLARGGRYAAMFATWASHAA
jgi:ATP-binding cassette, subfamily B, bacterial